MPFKLGKDTNEVYQLRFRQVELRALYLGTTRLWPEYNISTLANSLTHIGNLNKIGTSHFYNKALNPTTLGGAISTSITDYNVTFPTTSFHPDIDPAGCTLSFNVYINETSSWHYLKFVIACPPEITKVQITNNTGVNKVYTSSTNIQSYTAFSGQSYSANYFTVDLDNYYINNNLNAVAGYYDEPLNFTFTIDQNHTNNVRYHEISLISVNDEFNRAGYALNSKKILTVYRQKINFIINFNALSNKTFAHSYCGETTSPSDYSNLNSYITGTNLDLIESSYWTVSGSNSAWTLSMNGAKLSVTFPSASNTICISGSSCTLTFTYYYRLKSTDSYSSVSKSATFTLSPSNNWVPFVNYTSIAIDTYTVSIRINTGVKNISVYKNDTLVNTYSSTTNNAFTANYRDRIKWIATADAGYSLNTGDGWTDKSGTEFISANSTIAPTATRIQYTIRVYLDTHISKINVTGSTVSGNGNKDFTSDGTLTAYYGDTITWTASAVAEYEFIVSNEGSLTISSSFTVNTNKTIQPEDATWRPHIYLHMDAGIDYMILYDRKTDSPNIDECPKYMNSGTGAGSSTGTVLTGDKFRWTTHFRDGFEADYGCTGLYTDVRSDKHIYAYSKAVGQKLNPNLVIYFYPAGNRTTPIGSQYVMNGTTLDIVLPGTVNSGNYSGDIAFCVNVSNLPSGKKFNCDYCSDGTGTYDYLDREFSNNEMYYTMYQDGRHTGLYHDDITDGYKYILYFKFNENDTFNATSRLTVTITRMKVLTYSLSAKCGSNISKIEVRKNSSSGELLGTTDRTTTELIGYYKENTTIWWKSTVASGCEIISGITTGSKWTAGTGTGTLTTNTVINPSATEVENETYTLTIKILTDGSSAINLTNGIGGSVEVYRNGTKIPPYLNRFKYYGLEEGDQIKFTCNPSTNYYFNGATSADWPGFTVAYTAFGTYSFTRTFPGNDCTVEIAFINQNPTIQYTIGIVQPQSGAGTATLSSGSNSVGSSGTTVKSLTLDKGSSFTITASANTGYAFSKFVPAGGSDITTNPYNGTVSKSINYTVVFEGSLTITIKINEGVGSIQIFNGTTATGTPIISTSEDTTIKVQGGSTITWYANVSDSSKYSFDGATQKKETITLLNYGTLLIGPSTTKIESLPSQPDINYLFNVNTNGGIWNDNGKPNISIFLYPNTANFTEVTAIYSSQSSIPDSDSTKVNLFCASSNAYNKFKVYGATGTKSITWPCYVRFTCKQNGSQKTSGIVKITSGGDISISSAGLIALFNA